MKYLLKNMKIGMKITLLLGLAMLSVSLVAWLGFCEIGAVSREVAILTELNIPLTDALGNISFNSAEQWRHFERAVQNGRGMAYDSSLRDDFDAENKMVSKHSEAITREIVRGGKLLERLLESDRTAEEREYILKIDYELRDISKKHSTYQFAFNRTINLLSRGKDVEAQVMIDKIENMRLRSEEANALGRLLLAIGNYMQYSTAQSQKNKQMAIIKMFLVSGLILLSELCLGIIISRSITKPLFVAVNAARQIANGDRDIEFEVDRQDEAGQLLKAMKIMSSSVNESEYLLKKQTTDLEQSNELLSSEIADRKLIEKELSKHRNHLEELVAERTTSLEKSNEKLAQSNTELQDFVYIASHDLREPLRKITSFGGLVKESLGERLEEDDKENLDFMIDGAERMTQMIEALLVYSRLNTKDITLSTVDLNEVIEQFGQLELATLLEETNATIEVPRSLPRVKADKVLIRQLIQNIIVNGIKYQKRGTTPRIEITARQIDNGKVRIEFKDNGIGIKEEMHQAIFKMFKRVHSREEYEGTGIGLAVCKKIAERHGSQIGVDSEEGKGSIFWFTLSAATEPVAV